MLRRPATILLATCLFAVATAQARERLAGPVPAVVTAVLDGDTVEVRARIWLGQQLTVRVRLAGIDAPELRSACPAERRLAARARAFLIAELVPAAEVQLHDVRHGKFAGRVVARLESRAGRDLGDALVAAGLAVPAERRRSAVWCTAQGPD